MAEWMRPWRLIWEVPGSSPPPVAVMSLWKEGGRWSPTDVNLAVAHWGALGCLSWCRLGVSFLKKKKKNSWYIFMQLVSQEESMRLCAVKQCYTYRVVYNTTLKQKFALWSVQVKTARQLFSVCCWSPWKALSDDSKAIKSQKGINHIEWFFAKLMSFLFSLYKVKE